MLLKYPKVTLPPSGPAAGETPATQLSPRLMPSCRPEVGPVALPPLPIQEIEGGTRAGGSSPSRQQCSSKAQ